MSVTPLPATAAALTETHVYRSCLRKVPYATRKVARTALTRLRQSGALGDLQVYGCEHCPFFHVGHSLRARRVS